MGKQRASALLTALFIMTLVAIAATSLSTRLQLDIYRNRMVVNSDKLYLASKIVTFWAVHELSTTKKLRADDDGRLINYPSKYNKLYPEVIINGSIYDLQARFNINNLSDTKDRNSQQILFDLIDTTTQKTDKNEIAAIIYATIEWLKPYNLDEKHDKYSPAYLKHKPPYQAAHMLMQSSSEFRLVAGVTPDIYKAISPFITSLPTKTPINILSAPSEVLKSLKTGMNNDEVEEIHNFREKNPDTNALNELLQKLELPAGAVTTESEYFLSVAKAKSIDLNLVVYSVIKRGKEVNGLRTVNVLFETFNVE